MSKQTYLLPITALVLAEILWGFSSPLIKLGVQSIPPVIFISIKFLAASLVLLPFAIKTWKPLKPKDFGLLILASVVYNSLGGLALNLGLARTTSINAAVISLLGPLVLFVLSVEFLKEKMSLKTLVGVFTALAGSLVIIGRVWEGSDAGLTGNLLIVIAMLCVVVSTLLFKPLMNKTSTYQVVFMSFFAGILPVAIFSLTQLHTWNIRATTVASFNGLWLSLLAVLGANLLYFYALKRKTVQSTGIYNYLQPITTIVAAWFLLAERPSVMFALGAGLVFLGVYLAEFSKPYNIFLTKR